MCVYVPPFTSVHAACQGYLHHVPLVIMAKYSTTCMTLSKKISIAFYHLISVGGGALGEAD